MLCTGCISDLGKEEYYCRGTTQLLYFRCEINDDIQLTWNISELKFERHLNSLSDPDNVIREGSVIIAVEKLNTTEGKGNFISHLWIDFQKVQHPALTVRCRGSKNDMQEKKLIALGN